MSHTCQTPPLAQSKPTEELPSGVRGAPHLQHAHRKVLQAITAGMIYEEIVILTPPLQKEGSLHF